MRRPTTSEASISDAEIFAALVARRREASAAARASAAAQSSGYQAAERARVAADQDPSDGRLHTAARSVEAKAQSDALDELVEWLRTMTVEISPVLLDFEAARIEADTLPFDAGELEVEEPVPHLTLPLPPPGILAKVLPSSRVRYEQAVEEAKAEHAKAVAEHAERERGRTARLADALAAHEREVADASARATAHNRAIDALRARVEAGDPPALAAYFAAVLAASDYPMGFPRVATVALDTGGRLLVVDYELPGLEVVPATQAYRYISASDTFEEVPRPSARRRDLYAVVVASVALRSVRELFDADKGRALDRIAFNGYVHGKDRVTGEAVRPHLVSFETSREEFRLLEIDRTDPIVSMRSLGAAFSMNPADLAPVRQVIGVRSLGSNATLAGSPPQQ